MKEFVPIIQNLLCEILQVRSHFCCERVKNWDFVKYRDIFWGSVSFELTRISPQNFAFEIAPPVTTVSEFEVGVATLIRSMLLDHEIARMMHPH